MSNYKTLVIDHLLSESEFLKLVTIYQHCNNLVIFKPDGTEVIRLDHLDMGSMAYMKDASLLYPEYKGRYERSEQ